MSKNSEFLQVLYKKKTLASSYSLTYCVLECWGFFYNDCIYITHFHTSVLHHLFLASDTTNNVPAPDYMLQVLSCTICMGIPTKLHAHEYHGTYHYILYAITQFHAALVICNASITICIAALAACFWRYLPKQQSLF